MESTRTWRAQDGRAICGQVALAVVLRISVREAVALVGHCHGTQTRELVKVLRANGFICPDQCRPVREPPPLALAQLHSVKWKRHWHWVVVDGDRIWDGNFGTRSGRVHWPRGARITSYLPLTERNG